MANSVEIVVTANAANYTAAIDQAGKKLDQLAGKATGVGHATVSGTQAASGALRLMEGNVQNNIRAVERFLTTIPGVGEALKTAFPLVGGIAFAGMLVEMGTKVYEFQKKLQAIPADIQKGFGELNRSTEQAGAALDVTNDKLAIAIAKIEHKPVNELKLALDEDRVAAYGFATAMDAANSKVDALLAKNSTAGFLKQLGGFVFGNDQASTKGAETSIKKSFADVQKVSDEGVDAADNATPANADAVKLQTRINNWNALNKAIADTTASLAAAKAADKADGFASHSAEISDDEGALRQLKAQRHDLKGNADREDQTARQTSDEEAERKKAEGEKAAAAAAAAARKAAEARIHAMDVQLEQAQGQGFLPKSGDRVADFWKRRIDEFSAGSEQYNQIQAKMATALEAGRSKVERAIQLGRDGRATEGLEVLTGKKPDDAATAEDAKIALQVQGAGAFMNRESRKASGEQVAGSDELNLIQARTAARLEEQRIGEASGRTMSRHAAALALEAAHTREYTQEVETLQRALDRAKADPNTEEAQKKIQALQQQIATAQGGRDAQVQADRFNVDPGFTSAKTGLLDALDTTAAGFRDFARQMDEFTTSTLNRVNQTLIEQLTTGGRHRGQHLWTQAGHDVATNVTGLGLKNLEGMGAGYLEKSGFGKLLGFGKDKPLGSSESNPMWTKSADAQNPSLPSWLGGSDGSTSAASSVVSSFGKASGGDGDSAMNGIFSTLASAFIPGFADGISAFGGGMALVGERGPELVNLPGGSSVTPNHAINFGMTSGNTHHYHIDARGSHDPAATQAAVRRGIAEAAPHIVAASLKAGHEMKMRKPLTAR